MKEAIKNFSVLIVSALAVHVAYVTYIWPTAEKAVQAAGAAGESVPRDWFVIIQNWEQEICIILMLYCITQIILKLRKISKEQFLFTVDLLDNVEDSSFPEMLDELESLSKQFDESQLLETLKASLRRYKITGDVQNTADAIQTSVEALALRLEAENTMIRYVIWAIPSIGFIGTVRGIGQALSQADEALAGDITSMTASLGIAFNSTFVALIISIILMLLLHSLQRAQDKRLVDIQSYCEEFLVKRIS